MSPKPATVTQLRPRPGPQSESAPSSAPVGGAPPAGNLKNGPAWLSKPAKDLWHQIVPALEETYPDVLSVLDVPALALMLEHLAIAQAAATSMRGRGNAPAVTTVEDRNHGGTKKAPSSQVMRDHGKAFLELARDYGLTLRGRASIDLEKLLGATVPDTPDGDDLFED